MVRASGICLEGPGFNPQSGHLFCLTDFACQITKLEVKEEEEWKAQEAEERSGGIELARGRGEEKAGRRRATAGADQRTGEEMASGANCTVTMGGCLKSGGTWKEEDGPCW